METKLFIEQQEELNLDELMGVKGGSEPSEDTCTAAGSGCMVAGSGSIPPKQGTDN